MKQAPGENENLHPLMEGLQNLKYDPNENTALELAENYKADGNFYMKHKNFRMAVLSYSEGIKSKSGDNDLDAAILNNRSAAHYNLKNYRSSLNDAESCLKLKSDYMKSKIRAAQCCNELNKFQECLNYCDEILQEQIDNQQIIDLRKLCFTRKTEKERDERKQLALEKKRQKQFENIVNEIKKRKIKFENWTGEIDYKMLQPNLAPLADFPVSLDENLNFMWPTVFCYPEFLTTDFHQQLHENVM